jgi:steroid delta-isomerase-like uncharacterized protein
MGREAMQELIALRNEAINRHDVDALVPLYSAECRIESPLAAGVVHGRQALAKVYRTLFDAFPDIAITPEMLLVDGDSVVVSGWITGTYSGGFMGLPPSGKTVRLSVVTISTIEDGQIVAERRVYDFTGMLVQAGVLKAHSA